jgi:SAM-dependent methyltransferase
VVSHDACPLCGTTMLPWLTKGGRHLVRCPACRLTSVREGLATTADGVSIYEADDGVFFSDGNEDYYLDETNSQNSRLKLKWVQRWVPAGARLLDAGCNFGHFLREARAGYDARGFDVSPQAVAWGQRRFGVSSFVASIYDLAPALRGTFDAVTCWDVIEHLPDAPRALAALRALLTPRGHLLLSTPDAGSLVARLLGRRWHYVDPVQHLALFTRDNVTRLLDAAGFDVLGFGSLGHHYRLRYVTARLRYLHARGPLHWGAALAERVLAPWLGASVYLQLGDVMLVAARRRD